MIAFFTDRIDAVSLGGANDVTGVAANIATIVAAVAAVMAIRQWKEQQRWNGKYEVAEKALTLAYRMEEAMG
jgi:hypothetical protein